MKMKMILPMMLIAALPLGADAQNKSGLVMSNLDQTVKPADSFYHQLQFYVLKNTQIAHC
jgi:putative endopeptidase